MEIITAQKDKYFKEILNLFHINLPDGMPGVWMAG
jgi:UDP-N-acetyl-D-mannosaminuronic acid transferase (WecB/TagA/CpsF family)